MGLVALNRTLDQELLALMRGASLECPVCGEFVLHADGRAPRRPLPQLQTRERRIEAAVFSPCLASVPLPRGRRALETTIGWSSPLAVPQSRESGFGGL
jgi:hypothetical protein